MEQHALYAQFAILWRKPIFDVVAANIDEFMAALATFMRNEGDIDALTGVSENSYQRYYAKINATQCEYPRQTIVGMFEQQARALNDHPAVITKMKCSVIECCSNRPVALPTICNGNMG